MHRGLAVALVLLSVVAAPASAHVTSIAAENQTTTDGTVVVERVFTAGEEPFHVVVHADDGGEPGAPVGHRTVDTGHREDVDVPLDTGHLSTVTGNATHWVALHRDDDGDRQFEPDEEPVFVNALDEPVRSRFTLSVAPSAVTETPTPTAPSGTGPVAPGFGVAAALGALFAASFAARRWW